MIARANQVDTKGSTDPKTKENKFKKVFKNFFQSKVSKLKCCWRRDSRPRYHKRG